MDRKAVAQGEFYPSDEAELKNFIEKYRYKREKKDFISVLVPNAPYASSGDILTETIDALRLPDTVILAGVNHSGFGEDIAVWTEGDWQTPWGDVEVDRKAALELVKASNAKADIIAHVREYSIENVLPVLKYIKPDIKIVPVSFMGLPRAKLKSFAVDLSKFALNGFGIVMCSTLSMADNPTDMEAQDNTALGALLSVDGEALYDCVMEKGVMMEGVYPVAACLMASYLAGAVKGEIIKKKPSAAGIIFS